MATKAEVLARRELIHSILTDGKSYSIPEILQKVTKNYRIGLDGLNKDIKIVKKRITDENKTKRDLADSIALATYGDELKDKLASDIELELVLSQIATGNLKIQEWVKGEAVLRGVDPMEQIAAIDKIYKKRGTYPPAKSEIKHEGVLEALDAIKNASIEDLQKLAESKD